MRSTVFSMSQSGHSGSSYSSYSGASSRSADTGANYFGGVNELTMIAHEMYSDGYTLRMLRAFVVASSLALDHALENRLSGIELHDIPSPAPALGNGGGPDGVLEIWFCELDVGWVLQICQDQCSRWQLPLSDDKSTTLWQDSVERWIRGLTVMFQSMDMLVSNRHQMTAILRFGKASISKMFVLVEAVLSAFKPEKLQAVLDMYICVTNALYMCLQCIIYEHKEIFSMILDLLSTERERLWEAISSTMEEMRTFVEHDEGLWAMEIKHGGGDVHKNTRLVASSIVSLKKTILLTPNFLRSDSSFNLDVLIDKTADYLKDLLLRKSQLCLDPSLRYLFLLNNSYFVASLNLPLYLRFVILEHAPECKMYVDSYLDASWGPVLSCIAKSNFPRPIRRWINTSSLAKFESAFHKTYQAQKFWKVPDPCLRYVLQSAITGRVGSGYRDYLEEHPELEKHVGRESSSPEVLEEMLGELFEG